MVESQSLASEDPNLDSDLQKIRKKRANELKGRIWKVRQDTWGTLAQTTKDFASHFLPTDDIYGSSGSGSDDIPALAHFQYLAERRIGIAYKITMKPAQDAVRNRFKFMNTKTEEHLENKETEKILDFCERTDFYNQLAKAMFFERVFGVGFLVKYFSKNDKENQSFADPVKGNKEPVAFQAFPPTHMSPIDVYRTSYLDTDPQLWDLQGGVYNPQRIDHTRVHVFMTRDVTERWRGLSVFEPIWIPLMAYFQSQIYLLRAFAKLGNTIPYWLIDSPSNLVDVYDEYADLIEEMKMNGIYIGRKGDEFGFAPTQIGQGIAEMIEVWKEDIAAGTSFPVPILWGRVQSAGLSGAAYLMAERYYWNEISNIQASISDDVLRIFKDAGFKLKNTRIDWNLAITKTDQQRLLDEGMQIENELLKEQLIQTRLMTDQMIENPEGMQEGGEEGGKEGGKEEGEEEGAPTNKNDKGKPPGAGASSSNKDFREIIKKRRKQLLRNLYEPWSVKA